MIKEIVDTAKKVMATATGEPSTPALERPERGDPDYAAKIVAIKQAEIAATEQSQFKGSLAKVDRKEQDAALSVIQKAELNAVPKKPALPPYSGPEYGDKQKWGEVLAHSHNLLSGAQEGFCNFVFEQCGLKLEKLIAPALKELRELQVHFDLLTGKLHLHLDAAVREEFKRQTRDVIAGKADSVKTREQMDAEALLRRRILKQGRRDICTKAAALMTPIAGQIEAAIWDYTARLDKAERDRSKLTHLQFHASPELCCTIALARVVKNHFGVGPASPPIYQCGGLFAALIKG